ncbi:hypothetical protein ACIPW5_36410 [Streptomyces sp. NPDC090077]|uniref:SCO4402 family protein n=1 Tax=Streptomyces sp. NPDC090077 TaxID=3365938 RepID=UPI0037FE4BB8
MDQVEVLESSVKRNPENVSLPDMRAEVVGAVRALSDPEHQRLVWIERKFPSTEYFEDFTINVNILDDAAVLDHPHTTIGYTLASEEEAEAMSRLAECLDAVLRTTGEGATDQQIIADPLWVGVVDAARSALHLLTRHG